MRTSEILHLFHGAKQSGDEWIVRCPCPTHGKGRGDVNPSLSIKDGDKCIVLTCRASCNYKDICRAVGLNESDLFYESKQQANGLAKTIDDIYDYTDEDGAVLFQVVRYKPKSFRQRRPDSGSPDGWTWKTAGIRRVPFHLPQLIASVKKGHTIFITEGEKDALAMEKVEFAATTYAGGVKNWKQTEFAKYLSDAEVVIVADGDDAGRKGANELAASLYGVAENIRVVECPDVDGKPVKDPADYFEAGGQPAELGELVHYAPIWTPETPEKKIDEIIAARKFVHSRKPPPLRAVYSLCGTSISTRGNLTVITALEKTGKSAVIGAMVAAAMPHSHDADLLGFTSDNSEGKAVLWFDSEQPEEDHWDCATRALKRAGLTEPPPWFDSYWLTGLPYLEAWDFVLRVIHKAKEQYSGIHSIFMDGAADFVSDVNDAKECNAKVTELHNLAIQNDCPLVSIIHYNPGTEKSRGHLGSQLGRKAESNLALEKDNDEVTVIYSTRQRRAPIPKHLGPRFRFSAEHGMHISVESKAASKEQLERETLSHLAGEVFSERPAMRYSELQVTLKTRLRVSDATADRKTARAIKLGVIKKSVAGLYVLNT